MHKLAAVSLCPYMRNSKITNMLHLTFTKTRFL